MGACVPLEPGASTGYSRPLADEVTVRVPPERSTMTAARVSRAPEASMGGSMVATGRPTRLLGAGPPVTTASDRSMIVAAP